jgi:hypothetical protein
MARSKSTKRPDKPASNLNSGGSDFIIPFKILKPIKSKLKEKFTDYDVDKEEVKEVVHVFHESDKDYNLIDLMKHIIKLTITICGRE